MTAVVLRAAERRYGPRVALAPCDLEVAPGEVLGLVGPNGSGKTTLLRLLAGFLRPTTGEVRVLGLEPFSARPQVMRRARFAFAPPPLYERLSAREHLVHLGGLGGRRPARAEVDAALETVGLRERAEEPVSRFSFGMRQRLVLAQALVPRPELLVLDEPTDGLDPLAVIDLRTVLRRLNEEHGTTIVLSSHVMLEVDALVDRLLVLFEGRALFLGAPAELREAGARLRIEATPLDAVRAALAARGVVHEADRDGGLLLELNSLSLEDAAALCRAAGAELRAFHPQQPDLETALLARYREVLR